jgi:hypothetical protein
MDGDFLEILARASWHDFRYLAREQEISIHPIVFERNNKTWGGRLLLAQS